MASERYSAPERAEGKPVDTVLQRGDLELLLALGVDSDGEPPTGRAAAMIEDMTGRQIKALRGRLVAESLRMLELEARIRATHRAITHTLRAVTTDPNTKETP